MKCPKCLRKSKEVGSVFYERGEWDGKKYDEEGNADLFECNCGCRFAVLDAGDAHGLHNFIAMVSRMTKDGEVVEGREFVMENDDAVSTLNNLIEMARELANEKTVKGAEIPTPKELIEIHGNWGEHPDYQRADWQAEVANGDTNRGYWDWVSSRIEQKQDEKQDIH